MAHESARRTILMTLAAFAALSPAAARADIEAPAPAIEVAYNLAIVSDYRFRGISLTNRDPAVQGGIDLAFRSGFFLGTWASTIADYGGSKLEVDIYGGYGGSLAGLDYTLGAYGYLYPGGSAVNYVELQGTLARTAGPVTTTLTIAYIPDQKNAVDNIYTGLGAALAIGDTPLTVSAGIGRENGGYDEKWDWSAGLAYKLDAMEISASYVDSNYKGALEAGHNGGAGVVLSAVVIF